MYFALLVILIIFFLLTGSGILKFSRENTKNFFLIVAIAVTFLCVAILFSYNYQKMDALVIVLLLVVTVSFGVFFSIRRL